MNIPTWPNHPGKSMRPAQTKTVWGILSALIVLIAAAAAGCGGDEEVEPTVEPLLGTYTVSHPAIVGSEKRDSVILVITNGREYTVDHYPAVTGGVTEICSSSGGISGFGTGLAVLTPRRTSGTNCDTVRIPRGEFVADFRNHGDTVYLDQTSNDSTYSFRLLPE